jgi:hypothetical protein
MTAPRIYCWINSGAGTEWVMSVALAEDGACLGQHCSSSDGFARMDIGYVEPLGPVSGPGQEKRRRFAEHYPDGYELVWVDDPLHHEGLGAAYALNQAQRATVTP